MAKTAIRDVRCRFSLLLLTAVAHLLSRTTQRVAIGLCGRGDRQALCGTAHDQGPGRRQAEARGRADLDGRHGWVRSQAGPVWPARWPLPPTSRIMADRCAARIEPAATYEYRTPAASWTVGKCGPWSQVRLQGKAVLVS